MLKTFQIEGKNRQEIVNNRFKCWSILKEMYRYNMSKCGDFFRAIVVTTKLAINSGKICSSVDITTHFIIEKTVKKNNEFD